MSQHTPGPWAADFTSSAVRVSAPEGSWICKINWYSQLRKAMRDEAEANARLIAAAPDLLAALEVAHHALSHPTDGWKDEVENKALPIVSAAIAKTRGRT